MTIRPTDLDKLRFSGQQSPTAARRDHDDFVAFLKARLSEERAMVELDDPTTFDNAERLRLLDSILLDLRAGVLPTDDRLRVLWAIYQGHQDAKPSWRPSRR